MIKSLVKISVLAAALFNVAGSAIAQSSPVDTKGVVPYVIDQRGLVAKSGFGLCWRTGFWTPAAAEAALAGQFPVGCECDKDLMPKAKCEPAAASKPAEPAKPAARAATPKPAAQKITLAADTLFDFDKATLKPEGKAKLDDLVGKVKGINLEVVIAVGHTDSVGADAYNQALSVKRSEAVKAYLVSKGVEKNRVYTEGKGEKQPVADNKTKEGKAKNRRVEIEVVGTRAKK